MVDEDAPVALTTQEGDIEVYWGAAGEHWCILMRRQPEAEERDGGEPSARGAHPRCGGAGSKRVEADDGADGSDDAEAQRPVRRPRRPGIVIED